MTLESKKWAFQKYEVGSKRRREQMDAFLGTHNVPELNWKAGRMWLNILQHEGRFLNEENIASCKAIRLAPRNEELFSELFEDATTNCETVSQFEVLESSCTEHSHEINAHTFTYIDCTEAQIDHNMSQDDDSVNDTHYMITAGEAGQEIVTYNTVIRMTQPINPGMVYCGGRSNVVVDGKNFSEH